MTSKKEIKLFPVCFMQWCSERCRSKIRLHFVCSLILISFVCKHCIKLFKHFFNPLSDDKILDWSKLKQFADDNFKFDENSRKFSKRVENTVGKGEIARYEQFLLFPQSFQKAYFPGASKGVVVWEWLKLTHYQMTKFRLVQIETNCTQHFKLHLKWKISTI